ncbi:MAG: SusC/RagA family TonB-linked outer membrane protein [Muribaculaceae bacterium]|nr:SusC/RagA family TonB-linked outer membrane protein [Muribaculaceae bacterium]
MRKLFLILVTLIMCSWSAYAQNVTYHGTVVDAETDEPLIGATVMPIGGGQGTATDLDGNFTVTVPQYVNQAEFSYVGYKPATLQLSDKMVVRLSTTATALEDVMVVAFGTTTKEAFTGSASVVNADDLKSRTTANVTDALVGSVPGLQLRSTTGAPGSGNGSITIRGLSSIYSDTQPLIIVDGAPYPESLSNISQDDIASISVLKDAASAALYGARGASGVVIITTKKGANREAEIKVNAKWGANTRAVQDYDVITDPGEYYEAFYAQIYNYNFLQQGMTPAAANAEANTKMLDLLKYNAYTLPEGENLIGLNGKLNPNATLGRYYQLNGENRYLIPDNFNDIAYQTGFRQEYNFSVNGGNEKSNFYASLSYLGEEGILKPSNYDRITAQIRSEYQVKKWLKLGARISYTHSNTKGNPDLNNSNWSAGNVLYFTAMAAPIYPMYVRTYDIVDGKPGTPYIMKDANGMPMYDFGSNTYVNGTRPFSAPGNAVGAQALDKAETSRNALNATLSATFDFTDYLKLDILSNVNWGLSQYTYYGSPYNQINATANGKLGKSDTNSVRTNNSQTLTFYKYFGDHYLNVLAGHEYYRVDTNFLQGYAEGGFSPDILELFAFANHNFSDNTSYKGRYNVEGWFGSVQYNFREKYYASASYRRDASSRFAKDHRWGDFWSVGAAWMISKENFMEASKNWLDYLKLKLSIGQQGNDNLGGSYYWTDNYTLYPSGDKFMSPTFRSLGNPDITWETTTNLNAGLEFGFFKNRLFGNVDFYNKNTSNLLFWLSIPESTGARGYYGNMGTIRNTGVEISLTGTPIQTRDFEWSISANISTNKTKIVSLPAQKTENYGGFYESNHWFEEGGELYNYMTYAYAGVNEHGEALYYYDPNLIQSNGSMITQKPGKIKSMDYVTTETTQASRYAVGSILPKAYGGFSTTARLKWFDFTLNFDYQIGGKVMDLRYASLMAPESNMTQTSGNTIHKDYIKEWSPSNTSSNLPRWQWGDTQGYLSSDRFLTNAGYINFSSFVVGFTVPKFWKEISKLRIYCAGENLCFWSARKGLDPRYSFDGNTSLGAYSPMRSVSGGVEITF